MYSMCNGAMCPFGLSVSSWQNYVSVALARQRCRGAEETSVEKAVADPDLESEEPGILRDFGLSGFETNDGLFTRLRNRKPNFEKFKSFSTLKHRSYRLASSQPERAKDPSTSAPEPCGSSEEDNDQNCPSHPPGRRSFPSSFALLGHLRRRRREAQDNGDVQPSLSPQKHLSPPSLPMNVEITEGDVYRPEVYFPSVYRFPAECLAEMCEYEFLTPITPKLKQSNGQTVYSALCGRAAWFECSETHLMFRMKDLGEVVYSTTNWEGAFQTPAGWMPAGPLWDIKCPQETVCEMKFPHCEIFTGDRRDFLSVAHVTADGMEILPPLEVNDTHVTVSIAGLSFFGLITSWLSNTIRGQVLLFLRPIFEDQEQIMNVFLLPSNVLLTQVQEYQKGNIHIPTTSMCTLTHEREYSVRCDLEEKHHIQPKKEKFYRFIDGNFYPTFEVFLCTDVKQINMEVVDQKEDREVWGRRVKLPASEKISNHPLETEQSANFVDKHRATLIERVTLVDPILDRLSTLVHPEARARVQAAATSQGKMRLLYDITFRSGGTEVKSRFFEILKEIHPHLVRELNTIY